MSDAPRELPKPGAIIDGKYEIVALVGKGGMGSVYEAKHLRLNQRVALKMLHPEVKDAPGSIERFEREARAAGQLSSPHIARVLDVESHATDLPYIVMEFLEGTDLGAELAVLGKLPVTDAVDYVIQACIGVRDAHAAGVIHRDLKPANLLLSRTPEGPVVKIVDFGISKIMTESDGRLTAAMTTLGSPIYMSPEQLRDTKGVDGRTDIWGLGVILFELLAGKPPFNGTVTAVTAAIVSDAAPSLASLRTDLPSGLSTVVAKALEKKPDHRWPDALTFAEALAPFASATAEQRLQTALNAGTTGPFAPVSRLRAQAIHDPNAETQISEPKRLPGSETAAGWSTPRFTLPPSKRRVAVIAAGVIVAAIAAGGVVFGLRSAREPMAGANTSATADVGPSTSASVDVGPSAGPHASATAVVVAPAPGAPPEPRAEPTRPPAATATSTARAASPGGTADAKPPSPSAARDAAKTAPAASNASRPAPPSPPTPPPASTYPPPTSNPLHL